MTIKSSKKSKNKKSNKSVFYNYKIKGIPTDFKFKQINKNTVEATVIPISAEFPLMKFQVDLETKTISVLEDELIKIASLKKSSRKTSSKKSIVIKNNNNFKIVNNVNLNDAINEISRDSQGKTNRILAYGIFTILIILAICFGAAYVLGSVQDAVSAIIKENTISVAIQKLTFWLLATREVKLRRHQ